MAIGPVSGYGNLISVQNNYRIDSIHGNPKKMDAIKKIGNEDYSGNPFAVVSKEDESEAKEIKARQSKPFDYQGAMLRATQNLSTKPADAESPKINLQDEMGRLMQGVRFSAETIGMA